MRGIWSIPSSYALGSGLVTTSHVGSLISLSLSIALSPEKKVSDPSLSMSIFKHTHLSLTSERLALHQGLTSSIFCSLAYQLPPLPHVHLNYLPLICVGATLQTLHSEGLVVAYACIYIHIHTYTHIHVVNYRPRRRMVMLVCPK